VSSIDNLHHRSTVQEITVELPCKVEHQTEVYKNGTVLHCLRLATTGGTYFGATFDEALSNLRKAYAPVYDLLTKKL